MAGGSALSQTPLEGVGSRLEGKVSLRAEERLAGDPRPGVSGVCLISPGPTNAAMGASKTLSQGHWGATGGPRAGEPQCEP